jgi:hypothetical protein
MQILGSLSKVDRKRISELQIKESLLKQKDSEKNYTPAKADFEQELNRIAFSYYNYKLTHRGVVSYKGFENCSRRMKSSSLNNLLNYNAFAPEGSCSTIPFDESLGYLSSEREIKRHISEKQSRDIKKYASKLTYYSSERKFQSKKSGKYSFKVAFLTLTAPESVSTTQFLRAFDGFLDYLRRTANCIYVWKKEFGKHGDNLHVHILVNNFIPYYLVDWKWKRLLLSQGVIWPKNEKGEDTSSHYRIELPRNPKQAGHYISKYLGKVEYTPENVGYLWGKSKILDECKESILIEGEVDNSELFTIFSKFKTVGSDFVKMCLVDLLKIDKICPVLFKIFEKQFYEFQSKLTLPQRFQYV